MNSGVLFVGVLIAGALWFVVYFRFSDFWTLPYSVFLTICLHEEVEKERALLWSWEILQEASKAGAKTLCQPFHAFELPCSASKCSFQPLWRLKPEGWKLSSSWDRVRDVGSPKNPDPQILLTESFWLSRPVYSSLNRRFLCHEGAKTGLAASAPSRYLLEMRASPNDCDVYLDLCSFGPVGLHFLGCCCKEFDWSYHNNGNT